MNKLQFLIQNKNVETTKKLTSILFKKLKFSNKLLVDNKGHTFVIKNENAIIFAANNNLISYYDLQFNDYWFTIK